MELWEIIKKGDAGELKRLIASGYDVKQGDEDGSTLLHHAACMGSSEMIQLLLEAGSEVNSCDSAGSTPLLEAVQENRKDIVQLLLSRGADSNLGRDMNGKALHYAASNGDVAIGRLLLEHKADVNALDNEADCWTPLHYATYNNHLDFTKILVESGSDIFAYAGLDWPLDLALDQGHKDVAKYLYMIVENAHPGSLGTPLHAAAGLRDKTLMMQITGGDYSIDICDYASRTPLHWTVGRDRMLFFRIILEAHARKITLQLPSKFRRGDVRTTIEFLLKKGAKIEAKDHANNTPLLTALQWGKEDAAEVLLDHNADVNASDDSGWTPVILAASGGRLNLLKTLLK
ncbi:MAG: ankyrin repeat domain-containing protein, partial [Anaerohalosphaera sp.]|nr:ankyrin repeat domain-containing protein [Anaerohalosphaera sp.]